MSSALDEVEIFVCTTNINPDTLGVRFPRSVAGVHTLFALWKDLE